MAKKSYGKSKKMCKVTFELPSQVATEHAVVVGEFNEWSVGAAPLKRRKDGRLSVTLSLPAERSYRYRFLLDGGRWENDWEADAYVGNEFGTEDSLITV
jgi:1,4-alpha-glucan branching enzyme